MPNYITLAASELPKTNPLAEGASAQLVQSWLTGLATKVGVVALRAERLMFSGLDDGELMGDLIHTLSVDLMLAESRAQLALAVYKQRAEVMTADASCDAGAKQSLKHIEKHLESIRATTAFAKRVATQVLEFPVD
jgi:hypothetical protein